MKQDTFRTIAVFSGSRSHAGKQWVEDKIRTILGSLDKDIVIMHGASASKDGNPIECADWVVDRVARELGFRAQKVPAKGKQYLKRNKEIAGIGHMLYAVPKSRKQGIKALQGEITRGGTEHTIRQFVVLNKPIHLIYP